MYAFVQTHTCMHSPFRMAAGTVAGIIQHHSVIPATEWITSHPRMALLLRRSSTHSV